MMIEDVRRPFGTGEDRKARIEMIPEEAASIEHLTFGKLVVDPNGPIAFASFQGITRISSGFLTKQITFAREDEVLGEGAEIDPATVADVVGQVGALVVRSLPDGNILTRRFRFRPEAGEGKPGRVAMVSTSWVVPQDFWKRQASYVAKEVAERLRANPDLEETWENERLKVSPNILKSPAHPAFSLENLDNDARFLAEILLQPREASINISSDKFTDEKTFLGALGRAVEAVERTNPGQTANLLVAVGVAQTLEGPWIQYNPRIPDSTS